MRPLLLFVLAAVLLTGCTSRPDQAKPLIGVTSPVGGAVAKGQTVIVEGYVFDSAGLRSITAGNTEVLAANAHGGKLTPFRFQVNAPQAGEVKVQIIATDMNGRTNSRELTLVLDDQPPKIRLEIVQLVDGGRLRIVGVATDSVAVDRVVVRYGSTFSRLNLPKRKSVNFFVEIPAKSAEIIAVDAAGNRAQVEAKP